MGTDEKIETLPLSKAADVLLEECRMVLPGIQALFGFQLMVVFTDGFGEKLTQGEQSLHLVAIGLIVIAIALIMTPAAYHRHQGGHIVTARFIAISTRLLLLSMPPLAIAVCLDFYLIMSAVVESPFIAPLAGAMLVLFVFFWFVLPRTRWLRRLAAGR